MSSSRLVQLDVYSLCHDIRSLLEAKVCSKKCAAGVWLRSITNGSEES